MYILRYMGTRYFCLQNIINTYNMSLFVSLFQELSEMGKIGKTVEEFFNQLLQKYFPDHQYHLQTARPPAPTLLMSDSERSDASTSEERPNKRKRKPEDIMHYPAQQ